MRSAPSELDDEVRVFLRGLKQGGVVMGLDRMREFLGILDNPQNRVPVVHIGGTNGKGSVAAMIESVLRRAGWRTGLYTSPHLVRLGERVQVNRKPLTNSELNSQVRDLLRVVQARVARQGPEASPSYFEFMTALAFFQFARSGCDIAVVEVGMGGRLDATNVVLPEVAAITSIGLDHTEYLGPTVAAIAEEKAGIIKPGRPVVIGVLPTEAEKVVRAVAGRQDAPVISVGENYVAHRARFPTTNLVGDHQRTNAATATLVARQLDARWKLDESTIAAGLQQVDWPARWQQIDVGGRAVIVDSSHNAEGARALERCLVELVTKTGYRPVVVVGVLGASRAKPLLEAIARHAAEIHLVVPKQRRACTYDELRALIPASFGGAVVRSSLERLFPQPGRVQTTDRVSLAVDPVPVVITGSIYLAGEVLVRLDPQRGPLEDELQDF